METCELYCDESCTVMKNEWFKHLNQSKEVQFKEVCVQFNTMNPNENRVIHVNKYDIKLFKRESPCFIFWIMWILWSPQFQLTKQSEIECETCFLHSRNKNMYDTSEIDILLYSYCSYMNTILYPTHTWKLIPWNSMCTSTSNKLVTQQQYDINNNNRLRFRNGSPSLLLEGVNTNNNSRIVTFWTPSHKSLLKQSISKPKTSKPTKATY